MGEATGILTRSRGDAEKTRADVLATPAADCEACWSKYRHTEDEMRRFHPLAGGGFTLETGWTVPVEG